LDLHRPCHQHRHLPLTSGGRQGPPRAAAAGSRIAFAIPAGGKIKARVWDGVTLSPERNAATFPTTTYQGSYSVAVALGGTRSLGLAYSACRLAGCGYTESPDKGIDMVWRESTDSGTNWKKTFKLADSTGTSVTGRQHRLNQYASVVIVGAKRFVIWDAFAGNYSKGSQLLRIGIGTP
jgi:hypothetical protein